MQLDINDLKNSNGFLNVLYDNVTSAIFLADSSPRIYSFNDAFHTLFYKPEDAILKQLCGNAIGCIFQAAEQVDCGKTSHCPECQLRRNILKSFMEKVPVFKEHLVREFVLDGKPVRKHFVFTTRYVEYLESPMIMVIVDDVTELEESRKQMAQRNCDLEVLISRNMDAIRQLNDLIARNRDERESLVREIHHRVGNSLQSIVSLLWLQMRAAENEDGSCLEEANRRIQILKSIYNLVLSSRDINAIRVDLFIKLLLPVLQKWYGEQLRFAISDIEGDLNLPLASIISLSIIMNEAVHSSMEMVSGMQQASVVLSASFNDDGKLELDIRLDPVSPEVQESQVFCCQLIRLIAREERRRFTVKIDSDPLFRIIFH